MLLGRQRRNGAGGQINIYSVSDCFYIALHLPNKSNVTSSVTKHPCANLLHLHTALTRKIFSSCEVLGCEKRFINIKHFIFLVVLNQYESITHKAKAV
jgi:hypothetical protein